MEPARSAPPMVRDHQLALNGGGSRPATPTSEPGGRAHARSEADGQESAAAAARQSFETASTGAVPHPAEELYHSDASAGIIVEPVLTGVLSFLMSLEWVAPLKCVLICFRLLCGRLRYVGCSPGVFCAQATGSFA